MFSYNQRKDLITFPKKIFPGFSYPLRELANKVWIQVGRSYSHCALGFNYVCVIVANCEKSGLTQNWIHSQVKLWFLFTIRHVECNYFNPSMSNFLKTRIIKGLSALDLGKLWIRFTSRPNYGHMLAYFLLAVTQSCFLSSWLWDSVCSPYTRPVEALRPLRSWPDQCFVPDT